MNGRNEDSTGASPPSPGGPGLATRRRLRPRPLHLLAGVVAALVAAAIVASFWSVPYIAIVPGSAIDAESLVGVPSALRQHHRGQVLLTDVNIVYLKAIDYLWFKWNHDDAVEPTASVIGPASPSQYVSQGVIDMARARQAATVVGLRALGYPVRAAPSGVIVYQPLPGSPAASSLADDDVITAIDRRRVTTFASVALALDHAVPGKVVHVRVHPFGHGKAARTLPIRLGEFRQKTVNGQLVAVCVPSGSSTRLRPYEPEGVPLGCLGLDEQLSEVDYVTSGLPFRVTMDPHNIIGPSAGLAYTLALIQELDAENLTGGHKIAATGTMSMTGQVGDVGGVAQKTVAVRNAGATVFFVPAVEKATAEAHAGGKLKIFAVSNISQVLSDLRSLGGALVRRSGG